MPDKTKEELEAEQQELEGRVEEAATEAGKEAAKEGLSEDEVQKRVEAARKEEKDKLYPQLNEVKDSLKEVQQTLREEREEKEKIKREAEERAEKARQSKLSDTEKILEAQRRLEEQLKEERAAREESDRRNDEYKKQESLRRYREQVLKANDGKLLEELVSGQTEEEIDRSVQIAKARYEEIIEKVKADLGDTTRRNMPGPTNPDTEALEEEELDKSLSNVDTDKYMKDPEYREKIQNTLANEYAKAMGR